ncbi:Ig-like domain-containing protein, partial [Methanobrevibacter sp.]|uniref:Ig-like domain-containing protein n=1 Tax=Methanobrevibacter sp. TaxID=66852 RepID=UPI0038671DC5
LKGYAILVDDRAVDNNISKNYLDSEKGIGDKAINNTENNIIDNNYKYTFSAKINPVSAVYLEMSTVSMYIDSGTSVKFFIVRKSDGNIKEIGNTTSRNGKATINYRWDIFDKDAQFYIKAICSKRNYLTSEVTSSSTFKINKGNLYISIDDASAIKNNNVILKAVVKNSLGEGISGIEVPFEIYVNGKWTLLDKATTDGNGVAQKSTKISYDNGDYLIRAYIKALNNMPFNYPVSSNEATLSINSAGIKVNFNDVSVEKSSDATFTATVTNAANNGVSGLTVKFYKLNDLIGSAVTDANGVATLITKINYAIGDYAISANVTGDGIPSISKQANLKVSAASPDVKIFSDVYANGVLAKFMAANGNPLSNKKITLKIGETEYSLKTASDGTIKMPNVGHGKYIIDIAFAGDSTYKARKMLYSANVMPAVA